MSRVRIIARPPGEAPEWVRDAWIGLQLPVKPGSRGRRGRFLTSGVVSGPRDFWQWLAGLALGKFAVSSGYAVNAKDAVDLLAEKDPAAAGWWKENCSRMLDGKRFFVFAAEVCEESE